MTIDDQLRLWEPMIYYVIRTHQIHPNEIEDCAQAARIALWKAISQGKTLSKTYCYIRIRGSILNHQSSLKNTLSKEVTLEHMPESGQTDVSVLEFFDWASDVLPARHYTLLCHLLDGREQELGYSPSRLRAYQAELKNLLLQEVHQ